MRAALAVLFATLVVLVASTQTAHAIAHHERVVVDPIKSKGVVVGMRIKMTLRPESYNRVRVGINEAGKKYSGKQGDFRTGASDMKAGHLLHQFKEIKVKAHSPNEVTLEVRYKDVPGLKPGSKIEIVSAFNSGRKNDSYWHVYGMTSTLMSSPTFYDLPGTAAAAKPAAKKPAATAKKPAAKKPAATAKKPAAKKPTAQSIRQSSASSSSRARSASATRTSAARAKPAAARSSARTARNR